jgi:hypothetical protein
MNILNPKVRNRSDDSSLIQLDSETVITDNSSSEYVTGFGLNFYDDGEGAEDLRFVVCHTLSVMEESPTRKRIGDSLYLLPATLGSGSLAGRVVPVTGRLGASFRNADPVPLPCNYGSGSRNSKAGYSYSESEECNESNNESLHDYLSA